MVLNDGYIGRFFNRNKAQTFDAQVQDVEQFANDLRARCEALLADRCGQLDRLLREVKAQNEKLEVTLEKVKSESEEQCNHLIGQCVYCDFHTLLTTYLELRKKKCTPRSDP